jgi:hypothetical protein
MSTKKYAAFYTTIPFWVGKAPNIEGDKNKFFHEGIHLPEITLMYETDFYSIAICRDGLVMLHVNELEEKVKDSDPHDEEAEDIQWNAWGDYLDYLNALYLLLHTTTIQTNSPEFAIPPPKALSLSDVFRYVVENGEVIDIDVFSKVTGYGYSAMLNIDWLPPLSIAEKDTFDILNVEFEKVVLDNTLIKRLSQITKAYDEFQNGNFSYGLLLAWLIIESIILEKWDDLLTNKNKSFLDGNKRINSKRKQFLEGRDFPVSVIIDMLELDEQLTFEDFNELNTIRRYRNKIVHDSTSYTGNRKHCEKAIILAWKFSTEGKGIQPRSFLGYTLPFL